MSLLKGRDYYKPFDYPWAFDAYRLAYHDMHWGPQEAPMAEDIRDWNSRLTTAERELLTQLFRFFTQADVDVSKGYAEKYLPKFPVPEIRMMLFAFGAAEANHIHAYSTLIDTLGIPEVEYQAFQDYKAMAEKHEYMFERTLGRSISDLAAEIAVFSAFGEGMQLFSSFALLMSFQRRGLMKGMTTIVEWSIRDESLHVESMIKLFHTLVQEHKAVWNDELKKRIYDTCRQMVALEDAFIDQAFAFGDVEGVSAEETKQYIRYIADRRLLQLGLKPNFGVKENPFDWLDWIMNAPTHTNFFEQRSTEYGKGGISDFENSFSFLENPWDPATGAEPEFRIYTKDGCPFCVSAKQLLDAKGIAYDTVDLSDDAERQAFYAKTGLKTMPAIFGLYRGEEIKFMGGFDDLDRHFAAGDDA